MATAFCLGQGNYPPPQQPYPQDPNQQQQYPAQQQQQYPPPQQQPYPQQQYPPQQQQYPQQQYPAQQGYPPNGYPPQAAYSQQPPLQSPQQLDQLVGPIALYPDGLLAQVLTAATYSNEIVDAATWSTQHSYLHGEQLAAAMRADNLQFDPSVMALLPFPQVLDYMARNMNWTYQLSSAVLAQRPEVMDAVQRMRQQAYNYGYLRDPRFDQYERVVYGGPGNIEIVSASPDLYYVPAYSPFVVFAPPRPRMGVVFNFGPGIAIGGAFAPFGWAHVGFGWREHSILIDDRPWARTWNTRGYVHPYAEPYRRGPGPRVEEHREMRRDERREEHREH